jgi:hypothetical protein
MTGVDMFFSVLLLVILLLCAIQFIRFLATWGVPDFQGSDVRADIDVLETRRAYLVQDLRDLELDYQMNKVSEEEYHRTRSHLEPKTIAVIKELALLTSEDMIDGAELDG